MLWCDADVKTEGRYEIVHQDAHYSCVMGEWRDDGTGEGWAQGFTDNREYAIELCKAYVESTNFERDGSVYAIDSETSEVVDGSWIDVKKA